MDLCVMWSICSVLCEEFLLCSCEVFILCYVKTSYCVMCITVTNGLVAFRRARFARFASVQHPYNHSACLFRGRFRATDFPTHCHIYIYIYIYICIGWVDFWWFSSFGDCILGCRKGCFRILQLVFRQSGLSNFTPWRNYVTKLASSRNFSTWHPATQRMALTASLKGPLRGSFGVFKWVITGVLKGTFIYIYIYIYTLMYTCVHPYAHFCKNW